MAKCLFTIFSVIWKVVLRRKQWIGETGAPNGATFHYAAEFSNISCYVGSFIVWGSRGTLTYPAMRASLAFLAVFPPALIFGNNPIIDLAVTPSLLILFATGSQGARLIWT